ncbi:unnamed protein product [Tilletia caries]|nr:hypothetical protein CF335_g4279 [Tilletia laevis]CAD6884508.1 unnamed protein product [Tilletia caries]CAD6921287.1 unnamed protein product [Tilletia controversa]CAD6975507.1 unnamed protein product [Tilletia controversa]
MSLALTSSHAHCAYAIVHQQRGKQCAACSTLLGDIGYYECASRNWICEACVAQVVTQIRFWEKLSAPHWLASYFPSPIVHKGIMFKNVAILFQASKFTTAERFIEFSREDSAEKAFNKARFLQREVRSDWADIKVQVMVLCQYLKFSQNRQLGAWLLATNDIRLVECSDKFWGEGCGDGPNKLGRVLQEVRKLLKDGAIPKDLVAIRRF